MTASFDPVLYGTSRRSIVFIDAGYVLHVMQAHHQVARRADLQIDHQKLIDLVRQKAEVELGCPVLRIYWYDAVHPLGKISNLLAAEMQRVDGVKVRLGTLLERPDGGFEQKAVDTLLVRDMIAHAFKRTAHEMVLLSGDNDLVPGVEEAQEQGARVHLWSIVDEELPPSVGRQLSNLVDIRLDLAADDLAVVVARVLKPQPSMAGKVSPGSDPANGASTGGGGEHVSGDMVVLDQTAQQLRPTPTPVKSGSPTASFAPPSHVHSAEAGTFPTLYDMSRERYSEPINPKTARAAGRQYGERWASLVDAGTLARLLGSHAPGHSANIPKAVDGDLLYFGGDHGLDTYVHALKIALRSGFWDGVCASDAQGRKPGDQA